MQITPFELPEFDHNAAIKPVRRFKPAASANQKVEAPEEPPPPPPPPTFSEEELKTAEREAYKKGFLEGTKEGITQTQSEQADIEKQLCQTVAAFAQMVTPLLDAYKAMILQLEQDMPKVALTIAQKVAGEALAANAQTVVETMASNCVKLMIAEPKLMVSVHSSVATTLDDKLKKIAETYQSACAIAVKIDDSLSAADCRVEWKHGAMERHTGALWEAVERAVNNMSMDAKRRVDEQIGQLIAKLASGPAITDTQPEIQTEPNKGATYG